MEIQIGNTGGGRGTRVILSNGSVLALTEEHGELAIRGVDGPLIIKPSVANQIRVSVEVEDFQESNLQAIREELAKPPIRKSGVIVNEEIALGTPEWRAIHFPERER